MFLIDPKLQSDTHFIADLGISRLLLMNDCNYPWLILVPRVPGAVELIDLSGEEQTKLLDEINSLSKILKENFSAEKINIATLGNMVRQLHFHLIARYKNDASFPKPIWGALPTKPYLPEEAKEIITKIKSLIKK